MTKESLNLWRVPPHKVAEIRAAYDNREWMWLVSQWNEYNVTNWKLCAACPDSMDTVQKWIPLLWQQPA